MSASFYKKEPTTNPIEMHFVNLAHRLQLSTQKVKGVMLGIGDLGGSNAVDEQIVIDFCKFWREKQVGKEYPKYPSDIDFKKWYHRQQNQSKGDLCQYEMCHGDGYIYVEDAHGTTRCGKLCKCSISENFWNSMTSYYKVKPNPFYMSHELAEWKKKINEKPKFYENPKSNNKMTLGQIKDNLSEAFQND